MQGDLGPLPVQSSGPVSGHTAGTGFPATGPASYSRQTGWSARGHDSSLALTGSLLDSALRSTEGYADQLMENTASGSSRHLGPSGSVQPMDIGLNGSSDMMSATCSASVPIPGRGPNWPGSHATPDYMRMRDPLWRHSVDELGTSAGGEYCGDFAASGMISDPLQSPPLPATPRNSYQLPLSTSHDPDLSRNLQQIQIEDIFEGVDVCDLLSGPTLSALNADADDVTGVDEALVLSRSLGLEESQSSIPGDIKSEPVLADGSVDWLSEGTSIGTGDPSTVPTELYSVAGLSAPSSSYPRISPLVGNRDPLLANWRSSAAAPVTCSPGPSHSSPVPSHSSPGPSHSSPGPVLAQCKQLPGCTTPSTLQTLLSRPPLSCSPAARPPRQLTAPAVGAARLSSSVPADTSLAAAGVRLTPLSLAAARLDEACGSGSSISTASILSPYSIDSCMGDGNDSHDESFSDSDAGSVAGDDETSPLPRKDKYFWQYNVQSKGPKGHRLQLTPDLTDPLNIHEVVDPVFSSEFQTKGIKHSGKARRGDGNDLTPSPRKLLAIRRDLDKLNQLINDLTPPSELPFNVRPRSRKEKNKLASRACRLKKKAQHEAFKIQLAGLKDEHKRLSAGLSGMCELLKARLNSSDSPMVAAEETTAKLERIFRAANKSRVAGQLPEFVQRVLDKIESQSLSFVPLGVSACNLQSTEDYQMSSERG